MAKFVGSDIHSDNWGEDYLIKKLIEYFDDSYVIYRNRPIFGAQFDVCLLAPKIGIIIFEVKGWKPETIKEVRNGDTIVIKAHDSETGEEKEAYENPTSQARGYVYKMRSKIRQKTGKTPLVYDMVCFPNLTKADFDSKGLDSVCEYESTIIREDMESKAAFFAKMNLGIKNHKGALSHCSEFTPDLIYRVRQIFETDLNIENPSVENTDIVEGAETPVKNAYSLFAYVPQGEMSTALTEKLVTAYSTGTKLYVITEDCSDLCLFSDAIKTAVRSKGLAYDGLDLKIDFSGKGNEKKAGNTTSFQIFNCTAYAMEPLEDKIESFIIRDGKNISEKQNDVMKKIDSVCNFNLEQYRIEHSDPTKNIIVKAGAGTGKTFTMISRIAYVCHVQDCSMKEMARRIVMITFTDDAANQMEAKIKQYFNNYYLLTAWLSSIRLKECKSVRFILMQER